MFFAFQKKWSIYVGLQIVLNTKLTNLEIESDSFITLNLIKEGNPRSHLQNVVIDETHYLMNHTNTLISHIYRLTNQCVDHLARVGFEQDEDSVVLTEMPISY